MTVLVAYVSKHGSTRGIAAIGALRRRRWAALAHVGVSLSLLAWLAIQIPVVGFVAVFQITYGVIATALIALGVASGRARSASEPHHAGPGVERRGGRP